MHLDAIWLLLEQKSEGRFLKAEFSLHIHAHVGISISKQEGWICIFLLVTWQEQEESLKIFNKKCHNNCQAVRLSGSSSSTSLPPESLQVAISYN
jgi:hypothetical protein